MDKQTILINGKQSNIMFNASHSQEWSIEQSNQDTLNVLDELLKFKDSSVKYQKGITVLNALTTIQLVSNLSITRPSNHIGIIRFSTPPNTIITYRVKEEGLPRYGVIKSSKNIKLLEDLRDRILEHISKTDEAKSSIY
ncbi:MAG: hypothetical protein DRG78_10280 [Epsilonproteobacteria bacterium]|nr:MAG: hypothetical protein DRG78_10280 [Campylobacterota bacterium]